MPSPFPGMDPYLEDPRIWPDVHTNLITEIQGVLNKQLRPKYYVRVEERVYISDENDPGRTAIIPDLRIAERLELVGSAFKPGGTAAMELDEPVEATTLLDDEIHEAYLEVIDHAQRQVVTVIEVVSPTNKIAGSRGQASYRQKRNEVMNSPSHFMEIDLLRQGVAFVSREVLPACDYLVHVSRVQRRPKAKIWLIRLQRRLPVVSVPLKADDPDAKMDLQEVLNTVYDRAAYDLAIDYRTDPVPPLNVDQAGWADELLRGKGLR